MKRGFHSLARLLPIGLRAIPIGKLRLDEEPDI